MSNATKYVVVVSGFASQWLHNSRAEALDSTEALEASERGLHVIIRKVSTNVLWIDSNGNPHYA